jgi:hypothetical protein
MKSFALPFFTLFLVLTLGCNTGDTSKPAPTKAIIYYVPFQLTPNEVVTPANIREKSNAVEITDRKAISYLDKLLAKSQEGTNFDSSRVRFQILLEHPDRSVCVDYEGNLLEGTQQRRLDAKRFDNLQELISANVTTGGEK